MGRVERETGNAIVDRNPQGQHGGQMNSAFGFIYLLDRDRHSPALSKGSGLGVNLLAWRSWACGHNRARFGIPPEGIISGLGEKTPNALDRGMDGGEGAGANAHSLMFLRAAMLRRLPIVTSPELAESSAVRGKAC